MTKKRTKPKVMSAARDQPSENTIAATPARAADERIEKGYGSSGCRNVTGQIKGTLLENLNLAVDQAD